MFLWLMLLTPNVPISFLDSLICQLIFMIPFYVWIMYVCFNFYEFEFYEFKCNMIMINLILTPYIPPNN